MEYFNTLLHSHNYTDYLLNSIFAHHNLSTCQQHSVSNEDDLVSSNGFFNFDHYGDVWEGFLHNSLKGIDIAIEPSSKERSKLLTGPPKF